MVLWFLNAASALSPAGVGGFWVVEAVRKVKCHLGFILVRRFNGNLNATGWAVGGVSVPRQAALFGSVGDLFHHPVVGWSCIKTLNSLLEPVLCF